jgi:hypothetical protein
VLSLQEMLPNPSSCLNHTKQKEQTFFGTWLAKLR